MYATQLVGGEGTQVVGVAVAEGTGRGGRYSRRPAYMVCDCRQFACTIAETEVLCSIASLIKVSPGCTVYSCQP